MTSMWRTRKKLWLQGFQLQATPTEPLWRVNPRSSDRNVLKMIRRILQEQFDVRQVNKLVRTWPAIRNMRIPMSRYIYSAKRCQPKDNLPHSRDDQTHLVQRGDRIHLPGDNFRNPHFSGYPIQRDERCQ